MEIIDTLFGHGKDLNSLQMICRSIVTFFLTLIFLRIAGIRTFGKKTAFDNVIVILLGSVFSRVVVGASPFIPTALACLTFVLTHSLLGWLGFYHHRIGRWIKGESSLLYAKGEEQSRNMKHAQISRTDLLEAVRHELNEADLTNVDEIYIERGGELSVIRKKA